MHNQKSRDQFCSSVASIERQTPSRCDTQGTNPGSLACATLQAEFRSEDRAWKKLLVKETRVVFVCLQSSERTHMKRRSQFGGGAGVGGECGGWGGGIRRGGGR